MGWSGLVHTSFLFIQLKLISQKYGTCLNQRVLEKHVVCVTFICFLLMHVFANDCLSHLFITFFAFFKKVEILFFPSKS